MSNIAPFPGPTAAAVAQGGAGSPPPGPSAGGPLQAPRGRPSPRPLGGRFIIPIMLIGFNIDDSLDNNNVNNSGSLQLLTLVATFV